MNDKLINKLVFGIVLVYLLITSGIINDYGITIDEPQHFAVGEKYFHFYQSGHLDFYDDQPVIKNHPDFHNRQLQLQPYIMPPFANILSAATCFLFFQTLAIFDPISAHHLIMPILVAILLIFLYSFVKKQTDSFTGLVSVLALLTYPRFFGHTFNNVKDVPEVVLFSLTIILFVEWIYSKKERYFYSAFICWGLALATKMDAVLIPVILLLWQIPTIYKCFSVKGYFKPKIMMQLFVGVIITVGVVMLCYPPLLFQQGMTRSEFLVQIVKYIHSIGTNPDISWNLYAPSQILFVTPLVMMVLFLFGLAGLFRKFEQNDLGLLLIIWVLFPVIRHCFPKANHYDGLRHFLVFIVPFSIIISLGLVRLGERSTLFFKITKEWLLILLLLLLITPNLYSLVTLHPYQTTYYNLLVGGLKGAQEKEIPYASDYWLNSYREAWDWLNNNAKKGSNYYAYPEGYLFKFHVQRNDMKPTKVGKMSFPGKKYLTIPRNTYVVIVPRKLERMNKPMHLSEILTVTDQFKMVYQVKRQKGEIMTIYYIDQNVGSSIGSNKKVAVFNLPSANNDHM